MRKTKFEAMNFLSAIISTVLGLMVGVVAGFFLLITLNGFSGKAGDYAVYTYLLWAIIVAVVAGVVSFLATSYFGRTSMNKAFTVILAICISLLVSGIGNFIGIIISVIVADTVWKK